MAKKNLWKNRDGVVYSTSDNYEYSDFASALQNTIPAKQQNLKVQLDKKSRGGKQVTLVSGFIGKEDDLKELGKLLKSKCGVGGSAKNGEILVQGDQCFKIVELLTKEGYKAKKVGG